MPDAPDKSSFARRADVMLCGRFPELETQIFEVTPRNYVIVFDRDQQLAETIAAELINPSAPPRFRYRSQMMFQHNTFVVSIRSAMPISPKTSKARRSRSSTSEIISLLDFLSCRLCSPLVTGPVRAYR
jgi:hypothetical protein